MCKHPYGPQAMPCCLRFRCPSTSTKEVVPLATYVAPLPTAPRVSLFLPHLQHQHAKWTRACATCVHQEDTGWRSCAGRNHLRVFAGYKSWYPGKALIECRRTTSYHPSSTTRGTAQSKASHLGVSFECCPSFGTATATLILPTTGPGGLRVPYFPSSSSERGVSHPLTSSQW